MHNSSSIVTKCFLLALLCLPFLAKAQMRSDTMFFPNSPSAHEIRTYNDKNECIKRRLFYDTGELLYEENATTPGHELNYKAVGYYKSGKIEFTRQYIDDLAEGDSKGLYENGIVKYKESCHKDTCNVVYYYLSGVIKSKSRKIHAKSIFEENFCENGQLIDVIYPDSINYDYTKYFCSGNVMCKGTLNLSFPIGAWDEYYENGNISVLGQYSEIPGYKMIGEWKYFDKDGTLSLIEVYNNKGDLIEKRKMK